MQFRYRYARYADGDSITVTVGEGRRLTCCVRYNKPASTFTWTLPVGVTTQQPMGAQLLDVRVPYSFYEEVESCNEITLDIRRESPATSQLTCGATNRQDGLTGAELNATITLQVNGNYSILRTKQV